MKTLVLLVLVVTVLAVQAVHHKKHQKRHDTNPGKGECCKICKETCYEGCLFFKNPKKCPGDDTGDDKNGRVKCCECDCTDAPPKNAEPLRRHH